MGDLKADLSEIVQHSPLALDISEQDCQVLAGIAEMHTLKDNEVLFEEGVRENSVYLIVEGRLAVTKGGEGNRTTLHVLERGDLAGEMSFIDGTPHSATLMAHGDAKVLSLKRDRFESLLQSHPLVVYHVMRTIVRTVHSTLRRMNMQYIEMTNYISKTHGRY
jgi:CRP-like cAMP-binding protein